MLRHEAHDTGSPASRSSSHRFVALAGGVMVGVVVLAHLAGGAALLHGGLGGLSGNMSGAVILGLAVLLIMKFVLLAVIARARRRSLPSPPDRVSPEAS